MPLRERQLELPGPDEEAPRGASPLQWATLVMRAAARRPMVAFAVFVATMGAAVAYRQLAPATYRVETRVLTQRQQLLQTMTRSYDDLPTRTASDLVKRRENLVAIVRSANLVGSGPPRSDRGILDPVAALLDRPSSIDDDPVDALVAILDRKLIVTGESDGTITIQLDWRDPQQGYALVQGALQNFLEARYLKEVSAVDEVISVLRGRTVSLRQELDAAVEDAKRRRPQPGVSSLGGRSRGPSEELVRIQSLLDAKQRAIRDVEEFRRRRLADLEAQLDQARATLSELHPTVVGLRKDIEALSRDSTQIQALREEERKVRAQYSARLASEGLPPVAAGQAQIIMPPAQAEEDERVRDLRLQYEQMISRVNAAQVELDAARTAFKHRYSVIWPPQIPTEPVGPSAVKLFGAAAVAAFVLAVLAAAAPDLRAGRVVERWQVEKLLELTVLAESPRK